MRRLNLVLMLAMVLLTGCQKEEEKEFTTVKKKYPIEGIYQGRATLISLEAGLNKVKNNTVVITAFDGEKIMIETLRTSAVAYMSGTGNTYQYAPFFWIGRSDCNFDMVVVYDGVGRIVGDSLYESGSMRVNGHEGTWETRSLKIK